MKNLILVSILFAFFIQNLWSQNAQDTLMKNRSSDTVIVVGVGDIMLGSILPTKASLPKNEDCSGELEPTSNYFKTADVAFCNLEGVFTDTPEGRKKCKNPKICYTFGMPTKFANCLVDAGFDLISNANNHCADFGPRGRESTAKTLKAAGLHFAGTLAYPYTIYVKDSVKYGFCAFSPESGNCRFNNYVEAANTVKFLDSICDVVIVSFHSGAEGAACQHVTRKDEIFMGYNRGNVYEFSHRMIDAGADVIFGHGPHVTRAVEIYKERFIAYSMGNYCTYSNISVAGVCGVAPIVKLWLDKTGKYLKGQIIPTYQERFQPPKVDPQKRALKIIQNLSKEDFPEIKMIIDDNGFVTLPK